MNNQNVCAMLQAVFVVCVNLQGLFIFFFHCVRNASVRLEWKSILSRIQTYSSNTSNSDGHHSIRNSIPLRPVNCEIGYLESHSTRLS